MTARRKSRPTRGNDGTADPIAALAALAPLPLPPTTAESIYRDALDAVRAHPAYVLAEDYARGFPARADRVAATQARIAASANLVRRTAQAAAVRRAPSVVDDAPSF